MEESSDIPRVLILGGGLAGLAAAVALAPRGFRVSMLEARLRLGGRASSFQDATTGQLIDACQHVSMGCCTNFNHWCRTVGIAAHLETQKVLYFLTLDGGLSQFRADPFPAPLHLARSFLGAHFLTPAEKLRIGYGLASLRCHSSGDDPPFQEWLTRHHQTPRTINRFWGLILVSALNESIDRIGLRYARKVFLDGFLGQARGFEIDLPRVPLGRLYGEELLGWLARHQVAIHCQRSVKHMRITNNLVAEVETRQGEEYHADWIVAALPFDRLLDILPMEIREGHDYFRNWRNLETSPITSVHVWFDRPVLKLPHVVLVDCLGQWVFNRGRVGPGEHYIQIVVSAARQFLGLGHEEVRRRILDEVRRLFPLAGVANLVRSRVVTEHAATFSVLPEVDRWRPASTSPINNLVIAGDWTATGWPATMEGAVRSGYLAAEAILRKVGRPMRLVQPDL